MEETSDLGWEEWLATHEADVKRLAEEPHCPQCGRDLIVLILQNAYLSGHLCGHLHALNDLREEAEA